MMQKVTLPSGVSRVDSHNNYTAREGDTILVTDKQAAEIRKRTSDPERRVAGTDMGSVGTRKGRWCEPCRRLWQAWSVQCPKCGGETELQ